MNKRKKIEGRYFSKSLENHTKPSVKKSMLREVYENVKKEQKLRLNYINLSSQLQKLKKNKQNMKCELNSTFSIYNRSETTHLNTSNSH